MFGAARPRLAAKILDVDVVILVDLDEDRCGARVVDRARHRREREGIDQHLIAMGNARRLEADEERAAAGIHGRRIAAAYIGGEFLFQQRRMIAVRTVFSVAEQTGPSA